MIDSKEKERLKEEALTNLKGVLEELKNKLQIGSNERDTVLLLLGRTKDLESPEKVYDIVKYAIEKEGSMQKGNEIGSEIATFYSIEKNRIRKGLFEILNGIE